ncbi:MAG TPA: type IV pilus biogenesis protein PilP [Noviherbaspirillum sp.]|nr:type IV pilus biogenesis protein PilP [Noviherbaspirillum sp.]
MQNSLKSLFFLSFLMTSGAAFADSTAENLTKIEAETLILKAREKQLDVQSQIVTKQNEIASKQVAAGLLERVASMATMGDPIVLSIEGVGKRIYTSLQLNNGSTIDATVGDVLPNGMKVVAIRANEVIVQTPKRKNFRLGTGSLSSYNPAYPNGSAALPPLPPMLPSRERMQ